MLLFAVLNLMDDSNVHYLEDGGRDGWMRCPLIDTRFPGIKSSAAYLTACRAEGGLHFVLLVVYLISL